MKALKTIQTDFYQGLKAFFEELNIPINYWAEEPANPADILTKNYAKDNPAHQLMEEVYFLGVVNDDIFKKKHTLQSSEQFKDSISEDYPGIVLLGIRLKNRENGLLPTRSQLAEITRTFNREFKYTPVTIVFQYGSCISLANSERLKYKQKWREGEKVGKVSLLYNIKPAKIHSGHLKILRQLQINRTDISTYAALYQHWQEVLSVSVLNKSFYEELSNWYFWAIESVRFPGEPKDSLGEETRTHRAQNIIRLITRLIFCWFLKEKGLINSELFDESALENWLEFGEKSDSNYYKAILQNLFFATLNQKGKRDFRRDGQNYNVTNLFRYKKLFKKDEEEALTLFNKTPFLNGGLFECLDKPDENDKDENNKVERIDGFSDRDDNQLSVPNELFFDSEKGLITLLNSYVFTITENTPIEEEVALDPELLGRIFENLLAEIDPDSGESARKATGSFYTPREIVNYMATESLVEYLHNKTGLPQAELRPLFEMTAEKTSSGVPRTEFTAKNKEALLNALDKVKILDPACGSGAFPMGVLQKMVHVLQKLDPGNKEWKERQLQRAKQIPDPDIQQKLIEDIEEAFENNELDYGRKLYLIENCLYGVDIQPIATQISKLRFFISLVADQNTDPKKENLGIRPLPNLETKFVAANTLVGLERPKQGQTMELRNPDIEKKEKELSEVRHRHFSAKTPNTKKKYRKSDKKLREEIAQLLKNHGWFDKVANQVAAFNPYDQNASCNWFDPEWMFGVKDGFDVVIGNPPYVQIQKFARTQTQADLENQHYKTFKKTGDIYALFYERGLNLCKPACHAKGVGSGLLCYITSNKWMRAGYGEALRAFFASKNPLALLDFGGFKVFESATVDTNILLIQNKDSAEKSLQACHFQNDYQKEDEIDEYFQKNKINLKQLSADAWFIGSQAEMDLKQKIEEIGTPLKDWNVKINRGILTGFNKAFIISQAKRDELVATDPKSAEIIKPVLRGRDIKRYRHEWAGLYLINPHNGYKNENGEQVMPVKIEEYPAIKEHLDQFSEKLKKRMDKGVTPYNLRNCAYLEDFEKEKVVWNRIGKNKDFSIVEEGIYINDSMHFFTAEENLKFISCILNSKLIDWCLNLTIGDSVGGNSGNASNVKDIPIPKITPTNQALATQIEKFVDKILEITKKPFYDPKNPPKKQIKIERKIDELVYDLYGLSEEEVRIVDGGLGGV